jgi:hypothetical protein
MFLSPFQVHMSVAMQAQQELLLGVERSIKAAMLLALAPFTFGGTLLTVNGQW